MGEKIPKLALTFADILLVPMSTNNSRRDADLRSFFVKGVEMGSPFIVSPMMQMRSFALACGVLNSGGGFILDRFFPIEERVDFLETLVSKNIETDCIAAAIGVRNGLEDAKRLADTGVSIFAIDVAHGGRNDVYELIESLKQNGYKVIGGNVVTQDAAHRQLGSGVDALRVGFGNGSICLTRIETGFGVPQYTALQDIREEVDVFNSSIPVISDGGIVHYGDVVKAIHAGASSVMLGRQFAACPESAGAIVQVGMEVMKEYYGMASNRAADALGVERFLSEGVENSLIPVGLPVAELVAQLRKHLSVGMAYGDAKTLKELRTVPVVRVTPNGVRESGAHDILLAGG